MNDQFNKREYRCPQCHRLIYNRMMKACGYCAAEIPKELLFSDDEIAKFKQESEEMDAERQQRKIREEKEDLERRDNGGGEFFGMTFNLKKFK